MNNDMLEWLDKLRDGVANQNAEAERVARVAMAAEDMLEALESMTAWCRALGIYPEGWDKARAAIARATGETE